MKIIKILCTTLSLILLISCFAGCDSSESYVIYFELDSAPSTLDPQLANGMSEELIVRNLFEGLMRTDADGKIVSGAAEDYSLSPDGLTYSFKIRDDAKWSDGVAVTADDFVFAFNRAVAPKNKAPYAMTLSCIAGAKEILSGEKSGGLGITATDAKNLTITLTEPNPRFFEILTTSICMPCRKDIYNKAKGQYGMISDHIVSNGSYKIRFWEKQDKFSLRINRNSEYSGDFTSGSTAVIFNVGDSKGRAIRIDDGNLDMGFIDISEASDNSNYFKYEKTTYCLVINKNSPFGSTDFRKAFAKSIHRNRLKNELGVSLIESNSIIPGAVQLGGTALSSKITITIPPEYSPDDAHALYIAGAKSTEKLPSSVEILYYGNDDIKNLAGLLAENMQQALGAVVNTKTAENESKLFSAVKNGEYQLALVPITATDKEPYDFFTNFSKQSNNNIYGFSSNKFDSEIAKITSSANEATVKSASENAIKHLISDLSIIPVALYSEAFSYSKEFSCPVISPFGGVIDLALVKKN